MKNYEKLLIFMLVITVITTVLTVSVCAEENYTISGKWYFNETITFSPFGNLPSKGTASYYPVNFTFTKNGETITCNKFGIYVPDLFTYQYEFWYLEPSNNYTLTYTTESKQWSNEEYRYVDFGNSPQTVTANVYNAITQNAIKLECDGSTCPATDANMDNVCDDCGMTLLFSENILTPKDGRQIFRHLRHSMIHLLY